MGWRLDRCVQMRTGAGIVKQAETLDQTPIEPGDDSDGSTHDGCLNICSDESLKILVVEDDPVDLMAVQRMLGAQPETFVELSNASSLAGALAALDRQRPDLVLLELDLPDSRGLDTVRRLMAHSTHPACIILTDCQSDQVARQAIALGVQDYVLKVDLNTKSLSRAIRYAVDRRRVESRLRDSEEKFRALFESSRDAIMTLDAATWRFTSGNSATVKMFKAKDEAEFVSKGPWKVSPEFQSDGTRSDDKAKAMIAKAMQQGSHFFEWDHMRLDGEVFPATVLLTRVMLGERAFLEATVRDITEAKEAENALQASESRYRVLFESSPDGILIANIETKCFTHANPSICRMLGYTPEELRTLGVADVHPQDQLAHVIAEFEALGRGDKTVAASIPCLRKDGTVFLADISVGKAVLGGIACNVGFFRDITERQWGEELLRLRTRP